MKIPPQDPAEFERGKADGVAGKRDAATYNDFERGLSYRNGWRIGKMSREALESPPEANGGGRPAETAVAHTAPLPVLSKAKKPEQKREKPPPVDQLDLF